ncbi:MAG: CocE/NonD family hydrolase [Acidimicrobiia bacterium]|nr:CocE/NonD family hydrolase [Acidimicrobiia bacterium]
MLNAYEMVVQLDVKVPMRDGVNLSADLYRPRRSGPFPTLLCRTIYDNQQPRYADMVETFVQRGYAVVIQDCRGRYDSEGVWDPYVCEAPDGYDTQEWIGRQAWCDGNIGTFGISYVGFTQVQTAPLASKYLKCLIPEANQEDNFGHIYTEGVLHLQNAINFGWWIGGRTVHSYARLNFNPESIYWHLPLISALDEFNPHPSYKLFLSHPTFDDYWKSYSLKGNYKDIEVPALHITGWYDNLVHEQFKTFRGWSQEAKTVEARRLTKMIVGPWVHTALGSTNSYGDVQFGPQAAMDLMAVRLRWFDQRLRGIDTAIDREPPLRLFVMGSNVWRDEHEWPLARTQFTNYYLHSEGRANSLFGDGVLSTVRPGEELADTYDYDPTNPVPSHGGQSQMADNMGPRDRRQVERRDDVLVYSTPALGQDVEVTGPIEMVLYAASSAVDTDFTATLVDVYPSGQAIIVTEGVVRASYRHSLEQATLMTPGTVYAFRIILWETSLCFRAGHRIRLEISSSNFPHWNRNLNTGEDLATGVRIEIARQTILHNAQYPSHVVLPVIPAL